MTGSYLAENSEDMDNLTAKDVIFGTTNMFSELPKLCALGFYAGLIQNHGFSKEESNSIMRTYMKENDLSYNDSFAFLKECMEKDGFFKLIGLDKVMEGMTEKRRVMGRTLAHEALNAEKGACSLYCAILSV